MPCIVACALFFILCVTAQAQSTPPLVLPELATQQWISQPQKVDKEAFLSAKTGVRGQTTWLRERL